MGPARLSTSCPSRASPTPRRKRARLCCAASTTRSPTFARSGPTGSKVRPRRLPRLIERVLANDAVELAVEGTLPFDQLGGGQPYRFQRDRGSPPRPRDDELLDLSRTGQLALSLAEMKTIQRHFTELGRDPTDCELETLAQTWSEHCSHKTLRGRIAFRGRTIDNLLKQTIFSATRELGCDWLVSVFTDNAGRRSV